MSANRATLWRLLAVFISAYLLACAFPLPPALKSMEGSSAAWLGLIPLILVSRLSRPRQAFRWGWLCGFIFWLVSAAWVLQLRHTWGYLPVVLLAWVALAGYCALYVGLFAAVLSGVFPDSSEDSIKASKRQLRRLGVIVAAPVIWVGCEYLRGVLFTGFPWNLLGSSQYKNIAVIQLATLGGVYLVSGLIVLLNTALAITALRVVHEVRNHSGRRRVHVELMLGLAILAFSWLFGVKAVRKSEALGDRSLQVRIAAVQPSIAQRQKWSEEYWREAYSVLSEQTELAMLSSPELILWPETAIPDLLTIDPTAQSVVASLVSNDFRLLVGSMDLDQPEDAPLYYNASYLVGPGAVIEGVYRKRHLVPFGEYLPFQNVISFIKKLAPLGFSCASGGLDQRMELALDAATVISFSVLICFEDIFPYLARRDVMAGARFIVNQTNDAWFDGSAASRQHMANAVFRAVENRVPMVRCANTGVTCFIDRCGRIVEMLTGDGTRTNLKGFSVAELKLATSRITPTPYTRFGDWLIARPCAIILILLVISGVIKGRRNERRCKTAF
jgi:apolipoprotein N-acyltransferase